MKLESVMLTYQVTHKDLDVISECMLSDAGIYETAEKLDGKLSPDKVFVVAKALALEDHGCKIEDIAPKMLLERLSLNEQREGSWKIRAEYNKELKRLTSIQEDISLLVKERDGVINVRELAD
jgi:hypothetical protein